MSKVIFNSDSEFLGTMTATSVSNAIGDVLTLDAFNVIKKRTYAEILGDIGAAPSVHTHTNFVLKAGDTMTGALISPQGIFGHTFTSPYSLSTQTNTAFTYMEILNSAGAGKGAFFGLENNDFAQYNDQGGDITFWTNPTTGVYTKSLGIDTAGNVDVSRGVLSVIGQTVWHTGNLTPSSYVLKAGDTMTGDLIIDNGATQENLIIENGFISAKNNSNTWRAVLGNSGTANNYLVGGSSVGSTNSLDTFLRIRSISDGDLTFQENSLAHKIWHSGNDGAGSTLDADLYHGYDISAAGNRWGVIAEVRTDGVMNVGKYIDFHNTDGTTGLDGRITLNSLNNWTFSNGAVTASRWESNTITANTVTATDTARLDGYGIMGNRSTAMYFTNGATGGSVRIGNGGIHNIKNIAVFDDIGVDVTGAVIASGEIRANNYVSLNQGNDATLFTFNTERAWAFKQIGTGAATGLALRDLAGAKTFYIQDSSGVSNHTFTSSGSYSSTGAITGANGIISGASVTIGAGVLQNNILQSRDKIRVWNSNLYTIGMDSAYTFGGLNDYAMTFQMNNDVDRGFWWGHDGHTKAQGAMSLTTGGVLTVNNTVTATNFILSSDERLKENIKTLERDPLNLRWVEFDRIEDGEHQLGLIAQEVEKTNPEFVITDKNGFKTVKYIDVLVAKMAEKDKQIEDLETRMERLELIIKELL